MPKCVEEKTQMSITPEIGQTYQYYNTSAGQWLDMILRDIVEPNEKMKFYEGQDMTKKIYILSYLDDPNNHKMYFEEKHILDPYYFRNLPKENN
jgi:hypothetical protein